MIAPIALLAALLAAPPAAPAAPGPAASATPASELRLLPAPRSVTPGSGRFPLRGEVRIAVAPGNADDAFAAALLAEEIESGSAAKARVVEGDAGDIVLAREASLADAGEEGYRIEVKPGGARLTARTGAGLYYAVQTLRQLVDGDGIPALAITDRPALRWRGLQDDVSRGPVPTVDALERRIRTAAEFKLNLYCLYFETAFAYRSQPLLVAPGGAISAAELRRLDAFAARHHVTLMVQQQSFGHLGSLLRWERYRALAEVDGGSTLSPAVEGTYTLLDSMYREIAPTTGAPFFHVGGDEPADLGQGRTRAMVQASGYAATYLRHLERLHDLLAPLGKRPMVWGDVALKFPELLPRMGHDFVIASWEYLAHDTYAPWIDPLRAAKADFLVCPGTNNWNRVFPDLDQALPGIRVFTREGQAAGALGQLDCTWADNGDALFALNWYPALYAAAAAWQPGDADPERFARAFDWAFFRNRGDEMAQAVRRLNAAHALVSKARPTDATLEVFWLNPARSPLDAKLCLMLEPVAVELQNTEEEALELIGRCRARARHNADLLEAYDLAARRLRSIGTRALTARRVRELYQQALRAQEEPNSAPRVLSLMTSLLELLAQRRQEAALLKTEHERLWLAEARPYFLANVLAQYDQDLRAWMDRADELKAYTVMARNGRRLPPAEQVGLGP